jgi:RimJ/RimL family protein N-acetyltransferase
VPSRRPFRIATERLVVRPLTRRDVTELTRYRNLPDVARFQDWPLPYTRDLAHALLDGLESTNGPTTDMWVQLGVARPDDALGGDTLIGDLAVWLDEQGALAVIGYTLAPQHQGRGYATEAVGGLVDWLIGRGVHRVAATLDPANIGSARVLERLGFRFTGTARAAAFVRGRWEDDARFEILADERRQWRVARTVRSVTLREIDADNVRDVLDVDRAFSQRRFVSSVAQSYGDALVPGDRDGDPVVPWFRAIYAGDRPAGFTMVAEPTEAHPEPYLWRFLVDWRFQRRGVGGKAIHAIADHWAVRGATAISLGCIADVPGTPEPFYRRLGFERTGHVNEWGETEMVAQIARLRRR